jgi:hypothetical protein
MAAPTSIHFPSRLFSDVWFQIAKTRSFISNASPHDQQGALRDAFGQLLDGNASPDTAGRSTGLARAC